MSPVLNGTGNLGCLEEDKIFNTVVAYIFTGNICFQEFEA